MGKSPSVPTYNTNMAISEQNRINQAAGMQQYANVVSPTGGYTTSVDPMTGRITVNKTLSDNSLLAMQKQMQALNNYTGDPTDAANAYYNAQMAYLQPQMDRQIARTESSLTNRGLPLGSNAWNSAIGDVYDAQNRALTAVSNDALANGQQFQTNILNQSGMLGGQVIDPTMIAGQAGAGMENTYDKQFANQVEQWKQKQANRNNMLGGVMSLAGTLGGAALGGPIGAAIGNRIMGTAE